MRLLRQTILQTLHRELARAEPKLSDVPQRHQDTRRLTCRQRSNQLLQHQVRLLPKSSSFDRDRTT